MTRYTYVASYYIGYTNSVRIYPPKENETYLHVARLASYSVFTCGQRPYDWDDNCSLLHFHSFGPVGSEIEV